MGRSSKGKGRRICTKKYSYVNLSWPGLPVVYMPCPHQHFKTPTVDRKSIGREQHINLLSTPKGYRWDNPQEKNKQLCPGKPSKKKLLCIESSDKQPCKSGMDDAMKCMTPDILEKLMNIFVEDFQMPKEEAKEFICDQKESSKVAQKMCKCPCAGDSEYVWTKEFADLIGCRLRNQIGLALCSWRTRRQKMLLEIVINCMNDISGECINIKCPETRMQKLMVFAADKMAVWLNRMLDEADKKIAEEDQAAKDALEAERRRREEEDALRREEEERRRREEEEAARLAAEEAARRAAEAVEPEPEAEPEVEPEPVPEEAEPEEVEPPRPEEPVEPEPAPPAEPEPPPPPPEEVPEPAPAPPEEVPEPEPVPVEAAPEEAVAEEPAEEVPEEPPEEAEPEEVPEVVEEAPEPEEEPEEFPPMEGLPEIEIEAEEPFDPNAAAMGAIVDWIKETDLVPSGRQKLISKIVKGRLATTLQEYADIEGMGTAIDALGNKVSTWIDKLASEAEKQIKPVIKASSKYPAPKGVLYHIKRGSDNYYKVRQVSCDEVASRKTRIDKPMTSDDVKDFTKWAEGLIHVSDAWTRWVENAFCEAYTMYNKNADKPSELTAKEFDTWRERKRREALDWKRAQKCIYNKAKRWEDWAKYTKTELLAGEGEGEGVLCDGDIGYQDDD